MPGTQKKHEVQPVCHEHHVKMKLTEIHLKGARDTPLIAAHACTEPDCQVHYNVSRGYFMPSYDANSTDLDVLALPKVRCSKDGAPMYLGATDEGKRGFRLWICPQCDARHTNEEDLVGVQPREVSGHVSAKRPA
jgi:hypothetical protein